MMCGGDCTPLIVVWLLPPRLTSCRCACCPSLYSALAVLGIKSVRLASVYLDKDMSTLPRCSSHDMTDLSTPKLGCTLNQRPQRRNCQSLVQCTLIACHYIALQEVE
jgi:hypothetical protein